MNKIIIPFVALLLLSNFAYSQQYPLFSHYQLNSFGFNPAVAGCTECPEARLVYREQWAGLKENPNTQILSMQGRLKRIPMGIGGYVFNDEAGKIKRTGFSTALTFAKKLDSLTTLSVGLGFGYYNIRVNDQYHSEIPTDATISNAVGGQWLGDFNGGVYLERKGAYIGFSVPQVLEPNLKFDDPNLSQSDLVRHYFAMAGYRFALNKKVELEPSGLVKLVEKVPSNWEASLRVILNKKIWLGGTYRNDQTFAAMAGIELNHQLLLGYAFDLSGTNLNKVSSGGHEITLGYRFCKPKDSDGDGVPDATDECPDEPGEVENSGCPFQDMIANNEDPGSGDKDGDGIRDEVDKCPNIAGSIANSGCPINDRDKDGIIDIKDKCPDLAGSLKTEGCPGEDTDKDGVVDAIDKCPDQPGLLYNDGCPAIAAEHEFPIDKISSKNVYFDSDKDNLKKAYFKDLDQLSEYLIDNPKWKVQLIGHTDERASPEYNMELSKRRVEAVMFYMLNRGVERNQIISEYYGEAEPSDVRHNVEGYQLNRRVEIILKFK